MKKNARRILAALTALAMLVIMLPASAVVVSAASYSCTTSLAELKELFPAGRYWNHVGKSSWDMYTTTTSPCTSSHKHGNCKYNGSCGCNSYKGTSIQCMGFAFMLQDVAFGGFNGYSATRNYNYTNAMNNLKAGDVIRYNNHSIFVTGVNGSTITYMDCNSDGKCGIRHDKTMTKSYLKSRFKYVTHAPVELSTGSSSLKTVDVFETAVVTAKSGLIIRQSADINSSKVGSLSKGTTVKVCNYELYDASGYCWRKLLDGRGFVCADYLDIRSGMSMIEGDYMIMCDNGGKLVTYTDNPRNDANIVLHDRLTGSTAKRQVWHFEPLYYYVDSGAIVYRITPAENSAYSLDCDAGNNQLLHLWESIGDLAAQEWCIEVRTDGSLRFVNTATGLVLDAENWGTANNTELLTYDNHDGANQSFRLVRPD